MLQCQMLASYQPVFMWYTSFYVTLLFFYVCYRLNILLSIDLWRGPGFLTSREHISAHHGGVSTDERPAGSALTQGQKKSKIQPHTWKFFLLKVQLNRSVLSSHKPLSCMKVLLKGSTNTSRLPKQTKWTKSSFSWLSIVRHVPLFDRRQTTTCCLPFF